MSEVIAGRVDFFFGPIGLVLPHLREGTLRALVVNSTRRAAALPDVPTTAEAGFANAEYPIWFGLFMPANTPREIVNKLNRETLSALDTPKLRDRFSALGIDSMPMTPAEFAAYVDKEIALNADLVNAAGIKVD
jgi:tripartite-type tricarboxylate transporter receptor subunit TctC